MNKTLYALVSLTAMIAMLSLTPAPTAAAPDLTGTWEGTADCRGFNGVNVRIVFEDDLSFTQSGTSLRMRFGAETFYRGRVIEDAAQPNTRGHAAIAACGLNDDFEGLSELFNMQVQTPAQGQHRLRATRVFFLEEGSGFGFGDGPVIGTCQLNYVRVSTADPEIADCP